MLDMGSSQLLSLMVQAAITYQDRWRNEMLLGAMSGQILELVPGSGESMILLRLVAALSAYELEESIHCRETLDGTLLVGLGHRVEADVHHVTIRIDPHATEVCERTKGFRSVWIYGDAEPTEAVMARLSDTHEPRPATLTS